VRLTCYLKKTCIYYIKNDTIVIFMEYVGGNSSNQMLCSHFNIPMRVFIPSPVSISGSRSLHFVPQELLCLDDEEKESLSKLKQEEEEFCSLVVRNETLNPLFFFTQSISKRLNFLVNRWKMDERSNL
jgi:hypothetical protein